MNTKIILFALFFVMLITHLATATSTWNLTIVPSNAFIQNTQYAHIAITGTSNSLVLLYADGRLLEGSKAPFNYSISNWVAGGHVILATNNATGINQTTYLTILPPEGSGGTPIYKRNTTASIISTMNTTKSLSAVQASILAMYNYEVAFSGVNGSLSIPIWYVLEGVLLVSVVILYVNAGKFQYPLVLAIGIFALFIIMGV